MTKLSIQEKLKQSHKAFEKLADNFGENDDFKDVLLDAILEVIYGPTGDDLSLPSDEKQIHDSNTNNTRKGEMPTYEIE